MRKTFILAVGSLLLAPWLPGASAATWQYYVPFTPPGAGKEPGKVFLWLPPESKSLRGLLVGGKLGIELELAQSEDVRKVCRKHDLGIVYFSPHVSALFHFWKNPGDTERWLKAFDDLAERSGHPELRRVPWITMGHSTAGIFCRNVAYWNPERVAAVLHIKSGNLFQKQHLPPSGSLVGVPMLFINGQFEIFGPEGGLKKEWGRETQWKSVRQDLQKLQQEDPNYLLTLMLDLGGDHFHSTPETNAYVARYLDKVAAFRLPRQLPAGKDPVVCTPIRRTDGWLTDAELGEPRKATAPFLHFTGDPRKAWWHFDAALAKDHEQHHRHAQHHQCLSTPTVTWLDDHDGWAFRVQAQFLDRMPEDYGGEVGGQAVGHAKGAILYRARGVDPVQQLGAQTFRVWRPVKSVFVAAAHPGDDHFRATHRWATVNLPENKGTAQTIDFQAIGELKANAAPVALKATANSGLPVDYEVDYGPVLVRDGKLHVSDLPEDARLPIECSVTAYQIGRRTGERIAAARPVTQVFFIRK